MTVALVLQTVALALQTIALALALDSSASPMTVALAL